MTSTIADIIRTVRIAASLLAVCLFAGASSVRAQEPPPRIGPFVLDLHATVPRFPSEDPVLAASRGLTLTELPGAGLGGQLGLHLYVFKLGAVTFGIGAEAAASRATKTPLQSAPGLRTVTETFRTLGSQLSLNFGTGHGWSYLSGGIGRSNWSLVPEGRDPLITDEDPIKTINYGGGARWFAKDHLAFSFDVRFYALNPGTPAPEFATGPPRTTFMTIGAGLSVK